MNLKADLVTDFLIIEKKKYGYYTQNLIYKFKL